VKLVLVQALRAAAALMVAFHHGQHEAASIAGRTGAAFAPSHLLPWAAGVDVFFAISGFIIVHAAAPLHGRPGGARLFMAHRLARIVPLYWLASLLYLALALAAPGRIGGGALEPGYVLASFLFWPAARPDGSVQPLYGLGWTLNFEMLFYVLFAAALALGAGRRGTVAVVAAVLGGLVALHLAVPGLPVPLAFWSETVVLEFLLGAGLGLVRVEGLRLSGPARIALALCGAGGLALSASLFGEAGGFLRPLVQGVPAACLVAAAALGPVRKEAQSGGVRLASLLGDASYALYLVHPFVLRGLGEGLLRSGLAAVLGPAACLALMLVGVVLAALAVHALVERPLGRRARALAERISGADLRVRGPAPGVSGSPEGR